MRIGLAHDVAVFSVQNSEKLKLLSIFTIIFSALFIIGTTLNAPGEGVYSSQIPIYILAFNLIFLLSLVAEYMGAWLRKDKLVHVCRCACALVAMGMALIELFVFMNFDASTLGAPEQPFSISSIVARFLS